MSAIYNSLTDSLLNEFQKIVGKEYFFDQPEIRWTYAFGGSIFEKEWMPDLILLPQSAHQVSEILKLANNNKIPITARGSGTSLSAGTMTPFGGIVLDMSQMNKILSIEVENNLVVLEPGVICDDLNDILKKDLEYFFPPDPGSSSVATIGGMVATNAGGIQAFKYGVTKNYVLFVEVVFPNGNIMKLGTDVLKSVSSYNLKDLIIGSEGTLGIITKIGMKIRPFPEHRKLGLFIFEDVEEIRQAVIELRKKGIVPDLLEFMDKVILGAVREYLGGEFLEFPDGYVLFAETDGNSKEDVEKDFSILFDIIMQHKPIFFTIAKDSSERERLILARKANLPALSRISPTTCVEDCTIKIDNFTEVIKKIERIPEEINAPNLKMAIICHMEGNLHPTFLFNENNEEDVKAFEKALNYLYNEIIIPAGGTLTGEHGIGKIKTPFLESEHGVMVVDLMSQIKKLFDPNMILNPGIGKGNNTSLMYKKTVRTLKNQPESILELNCMRCGFCIVTCPSRIYHKLEAYTPRGRLSILNGLVHGDLVLTDLITDILHTCTLCGLCVIKCPAGVQNHGIFEKAREIIHREVIEK